MKNKKNLLIVGVGILFFVIVGIGCYFIFHKDKETYNESENKIVSKEEYLGYHYVQREGKTNYYINNGNKYVSFDKKTGEKIAEFEIASDKFLELTNLGVDIINLYSYKDNDEYKLFNNKGEILKISKGVIKVSNNLFNYKSYYIYEDSLYDENDEVLYEGLFKDIDVANEQFRFNVYGSYVLFYNSGIGKIVNLNNYEEINIRSYFDADKYIEIEGKDVFYLLDLENDELHEFSRYEDKGYGKVLYKEEQKYIYTNSQIINFEDGLKYEGYTFDFTDCKDGFNIYYNGKLLSNECFYQYAKDKNNNIYINNSKTFYLRDGKLDDKIGVCSNGFAYYRNGLYVCNDGESSYLVNESLKKVTDSYDEIVCSDTYCKMFQNEKYGLLYNDKVIIEPVYSSINLLNNAIIAEDVFKLDYFLLGSEDFLSEDKLYRKIDDYKNINIEEIIIQYDLKDIEELINIDNDFFKQYAYVVQNNNSLNGFKEYVLKAYKEVILNKEYLDKEFFLYNLKNLRIEKVNKIDIPGIAGLYGDNTIHILYSATIKTLYHELTHFIDDRLNSSGGIGIVLIYEYLENYILEDEYNKLSKEEKKNFKNIGKLDFNFLTEGGAEYYTGVYFNNMITYSYPQQVVICNILNYLYGSDTMREIFFGREGQELLYKKFVEAGYDYEEINKFTEITERKKIAELSNKEKIYYIDMLIGLYEKEKDIKWYEDDIFSYFIATLLPYDLKKTDTDRYDEYTKIATITLNIKNKVYDKLGDSKYSYQINAVYFNNEMHILVAATRIIYGEIRHQVICYIYDSDKDELIDYKIVDE